MHPTYYVRHPDDTYSVVDPQPAEVLVDAAITTLSQLGRMVGNSEHENNRIRAALTGAFYEHLPLATPADAGAGLTEELAQQVLNALALAMTICDAVPTRLHKSEDSQLANIGMLVNAQDNGAHGYAVIRDAKAAFEQAATIPKGAARSWDGTTYYNIEEMYHHFEDGEALHMWLDDKGVPRADADGKVFSLVGRVARLSTPSAPVTAEPVATIHCQEFHELAMDYRAANPLNANAAYDALIAHIDARLTPAPADRDAIRDQALEEAALACACAIANRRPVYAKDMVAQIRALKSMERAADAAETRDASPWFDSAMDTGVIPTDSASGRAQRTNNDGE